MQNRLWRDLTPQRLMAVLAFVATGCFASAAMPQTAAPAPEWLQCPDSITIDLRPEPDRNPQRIREIAPQAGARSSEELYGHASYARFAYELYAAFDQGEDVRAAFQHPGLTLVSLIYGDPGPNTERGPRPPGRTRTFYGFVADEVATGRRYVVFRGTQQPAEWVRNVQAGQRPYPSGTRRRRAAAHVHAGFLQIFESLEIETNGRLTAFAPALPGLVGDRSTIFVGHSLGSALATLSGVEASRRAPERAAALRIVTLASPRVGDAGFAALAARVGRIDRICNLVDVVTAVPPSTRTIDYVHVGAPFRVSSFDWPALANDLPRTGDQILCWHGDQAYAFMLAPNQSPREPAQCFANQR